MNSLYGKFAQRLKYQQTYYEDIPFDIIAEYKSKKLEYKIHLFDMHREDCLLDVITKKQEFTYFAIPLFASYITSSARIELLEHLRNNKQNLVYCDTDSFFTESKPIKIEIGDKLGQFKFEKTVVEIRGLKNYTYLDDKGQRNDTIKGVSRKAEKIGKYKYKIQRYYNSKQSLRYRKKAGAGYTEIKQVTNIYDKRVVFPDGTTKAFDLTV